MPSKKNAKERANRIRNLLMKSGKKWDQLGLRLILKERIAPDDAGGIRALDYLWKKGSLTAQRSLNMAGFT